MATSDLGSRPVLISTFSCLGLGLELCSRCIGLSFLCLVFIAAPLLGISSSILSVFFTDKFALSQSDARISVAYKICQWKSLTKCLMKCPPGLDPNTTGYALARQDYLNPNPIGGGPFWHPHHFLFAVHLDRLEFHVQTSWHFSLKSPAYFDI